MFSSMKKEKNMEYEFFDIFLVKVIAKNIVLGFLETQCQNGFTV